MYHQLLSGVSLFVVAGEPHFAPHAPLRSLTGGPACVVLQIYRVHALYYGDRKVLGALLGVAAVAAVVGGVSAPTLARTHVRTCAGTALAHLALPPTQLIQARRNLSCTCAAWRKARTIISIQS